MLSFSDDTISVSIDVSRLEGIDEWVPIIKGVLMLFGFHIHTIDSILDWELSDLREQPPVGDKE